MAVRRDAGRRRLSWILVGAGAIAVVAGAYGATRSPLFDVDRVKITGAAFTPGAEIRRAGGLHDKPQIADVEPRVVVRALRRLPWVQDATLVRHWPSTVEIRIVEREPIATLAASGGGWALVDRTGRVLEVQPEAPPGLAVVEAPAAPSPGRQVAPEASAGLAVVDALPASLSQLLEKVTVAEDDSLALGLRGVPTVKFGRAEQVRAKLVALSTLVARTDLKGVRAIDVRVPTAPVLNRS